MKVDLPSIKCGKCGNTHRSVDQVKNCYALENPPKFVEPGQVEDTFVVGSNSGKIYMDVPYRDKEEVKKLGARWDRDAKKWWITKELQELNPEAWAPYVSNDADNPEPVGEGWYRKDEKIYKVVSGRNSGRMYAKVLVHYTDDKGKPRGKWKYSAGAINEIRPEHLMTIENQTEFGKLYGFCVRCGIPLSKEESQERGMGDICWGKAML